jgi:hypothetical protein
MMFNRTLAKMLPFGLWMACAFLAGAEPPQHYFANPICEQADPWIFQYQGHYLA